MHEVQKDRQIKTISMLNLGQGKSYSFGGPKRTIIVWMLARCITDYD